MIWFGGEQIYEGVDFFFFLVEKKNMRIENVICINLLSYP